MRKALFVLLLILGATARGETALESEPYPHVGVRTNQGAFVLELDGPRAPVTVTHFLGHVQDGSYDGSIFHRVIPGFMVQGGGMDQDFGELPAKRVIPNESGNGLRNERGTIAMARSAAPHSASRQFFINLVDNTSLDPRPGGWGYAVFGRVVEGMDVLDKIAAIPTGPGGSFPSDVPQSPVIIESMIVSDQRQNP
jgi:cyclophilin family peptidyl-prolyl cis-trans isomerase